MNNSVNSYAALDEADVQYSRLMILQTSSEPVISRKAEAGQIFDSLTGETSDSIHLVILGVRKEFRVWPESEKLSRYPEYISDDMKILARLNPDTGEKISEEPLESSEKWLTRCNNKKAKTQYTFFTAIPGKNSLAFLRISGLGYKHARRFLNQARNTQKQLYEFVTKLTVAEEQTPFGKKYIPAFQITDASLPEGWSGERGAQLCAGFIRKPQALAVSSQ